MTRKLRFRTCLSHLPSRVSLASFWQKLTGKFHKVRLHLLLAILVIGLFLRFYRRSVVEYYPDFMPILGGETLVHGQGYPFSYLGPIGPALFFAPLSFSFQVLDFAGVIIAISGTLLAGLGYLTCRVLLKDETAGLLASLVIATDPFLVYVSRVEWIDSLNSCLILTSLLSFPYVVKTNRVIAYLSYDGLLLLTLLFKTYNALILPALLIWIILQWKTKMWSALRTLVLTTGPAITGLALYLFSFPVELDRILTGARGSVAPVVGLKINFLSQAFTALTSYMYSPTGSISAITELSGRGYVVGGLSLDIGIIIFLPLSLLGAWSVWHYGGERKLLLGMLLLVALTFVVFTSFGGFHPRHIMTSRVIMISLFAVGATRLTRGVAV